MKGRKRVLLLILIMATACLMVAGITISILYRAAFKEERARLVETAQSQARLIEAIARHEDIRSTDYPGGPMAATLMQITDAHEHYKGFGNTGELALGRRWGDKIHFLLRHRHGGLDKPRPIPFDSELAEPMRRALYGKSGTMVGLDYRGRTVLAAHEPVELLNWGIVAKIDLAEIRTPFLRASAIGGGLAILVVLVGAGLFLRVSDPMIQCLEEKSKKLEMTNEQLQREVKERKHSEEALRESEEKYRTILESIEDGYFEVDIRGNFTFFNHSLCKIHGYSKDELMGMNYGQYMDPETAKMVYQTFNNVYKTEKPAKVSGWRIIRKDGTRRHIESSVSLIKDSSGRTLGFRGITRDVTERKKVEEALWNAKQEAEAASRAKSVFLANMSHEIRTPMNAVIGFTDILLDTDLDESQKDYAISIKKSGEVLLSLINDILDFSKIEAGELDFEKIEFDPELVAYDVCDLIRPRIGSKPVEILCRIGEKIPSRLRGDPGRFRQVLTNLMDNASKFTDSGEIELSVDVEEEEGDRVKLHAMVRDTGIGIPEDKLTAIFKPFQQADGSTTRKYGGTGLGLSVCKKISHFMDGDVWAESPAGQISDFESNAQQPEAEMQNRGSIFHFSAWFEKVEEKGTERFRSVSISGRKVLIVDDNQGNLNILSYVLESFGMRVVALRDGKEVIPSLQRALEAKDSFDLCLMDIQLSSINGYELAEQIRHFRSSRVDIESSIHSLPLIALSSLVDRDAKRCEKAGFDGFLSKPIRREKLFQMMERILGGKREGKDRVAKDRIMTQYSVREDRKRSVRILLAEDNPVNQKLAKMMLTRAGYQVDAVHNGQEAVERYTACSRDFDLILMDVQMPQMDGMEATKAIRNWEMSLGTGHSSLAKDNTNAKLQMTNDGSVAIRVPIVAMTAHAMKGDREDCLEAGMDDYITKPIRRELVFEIINKWVLQG